MFPGDNVCALKSLLAVAAGDAGADPASLGANGAFVLRKRELSAGVTGFVVDDFGCLSIGMFGVVVKMSI